MAAARQNTGIFKQTRAARGHYTKTTKRQRETLIERVMKGDASTRSVCLQLGIRYTTGRNIIDRWRRTGHFYKTEMEAKADEDEAGEPAISEDECGSEASCSDDQVSQDKTGHSTFSEP